MNGRLGRIRGVQRYVGVTRIHRNVGVARVHSNVWSGCVDGISCVWRDIRFNIRAGIRAPAGVGGTVRLAGVGRRLCRRSVVAAATAEKARRG